MLLLLVFITSYSLVPGRSIAYNRDQPVMRSEFERIYHKNNRVDGYEQKSVEEYLDLFINFKLKGTGSQKAGL